MAELYILASMEIHRFIKLSDFWFKNIKEPGPVIFYADNKSLCTH
jgi:hypothetical protein